MVLALRCRSRRCSKSSASTSNPTSMPRNATRRSAVRACSTGGGTDRGRERKKPFLGKSRRRSSNHILGLLVADSQRELDAAKLREEVWLQRSLWAHLFSVYCAHADIHSKRTENTTRSG